MLSSFVLLLVVAALSGLLVHSTLHIPDESGNYNDVYPPGIWSALTDTFKRHGGFEGFIGQLPNQALALRRLVLRLPPSARILEVGFNCGHSAGLMLSSRSDITLISLDVGRWTYTRPAKDVLDAAFPGRHELILGDSKLTLPQVSGAFDMFWIDGGHGRPEALSDLTQCLALARPGDLIVMDDILQGENPQQLWTEHPSAVWHEAIRAGRLVQLDYVEFGRGRGMAVGCRAL